MGVGISRPAPVLEDEEGEEGEMMLEELDRERSGVSIGVGTTLSGVVRALTR